MSDILMFATVLVPIITALVQLVKVTVDVPKNYIPLLSLLIGLVVGAAAFPFAEGLPLAVRLWAGGLAGLASTGLFEIGNSRLGTTKMSSKQKQ
ncbi:holin [Aureibacillus halotolerans]|uniref:A118-like holin Hol118 n=1 Tax=Aureibacillus halotolerans TaxID=1508390 RepID=A0A4R6TU70_9BACI|nr:holin [Aureibacillus halotolerans]TDQ33733.1 A118-like holin Hol118 [Aureibacillus halotolerans]